MSKETKSILSKTKTKKKIAKGSKKHTFTTYGGNFDHEIQRFILQIDSLSKATDLTMKTIKDEYHKDKERLDNFIDKKKIINEKDNTEIGIKIDDFTTFKQLNKNFYSCLLAGRNVPRSFLCSLVHHYDAYLGRLLRCVFLAKPELLNASEKKLTFADLFSFPSIKFASEYLIEKEVESIIRESHIVHFEWMENHFAMPLRKDLTIWPTFVEITERRNLFVHCDGIVSSQYINICKKNGVALDKHVKIGYELNVNQKYFQKAVECILEIGIKLGHVLWRKFKSESLSHADIALHNSTYDLLYAERYELTKTLLNFAIDVLKKKSSEEIKCMCLINLAIAQNFSGERSKALATLKNYDWSASEDKFKLAVAVIEHRYSDAVKIMKTIGSEGSIKPAYYSSWPLFKEFRHTTEFTATYKELFGEEFVFTKNDELSGEHQKVIEGH